MILNEWMKLIKIYVKWIIKSDEVYGGYEMKIEDR
jgi:hypothetical protein